ncbi:MAG: histone deacetylase, partial [Oceanobacter sp.]
MLPLVYHPNYSCPFPENHRFVMSKFARLFRYIINAGFDPEQLHQPESASLRQLSRAHSTDYLQGLFTNTLDAKEWKKLGLPWSQGLIDRTQTAPNGTLMAARLALQYGLASHLAGGTHHAHYDHGSGFCLINDLAYTALTLLDSGEVKRVLIFDLDVHQGDGTATILANEPNAFTCSIHCGKNFPFTKANSDLDIELEKGLEDQQYLTIVSNTLNNLLDELNPDL